MLIFYYQEKEIKFYTSIKQCQKRQYDERDFFAKPRISNTSENWANCIIKWIWTVKIYDMSIKWCRNHSTLTLRFWNITCPWYTYMMYIQNRLKNQHFAIVRNFLRNNLKPSNFALPASVLNSLLHMPEVSCQFWNISLDLRKMEWFNGKKNRK